ncbi:MAG: HAMP domain-containing histidine kinase [Chloroflexi bacterium]|uniref:histidine kinase n=1 Tax=Candidatus Chlorohelix allophototropha TaxID=3003348 RepID=A0A8T7M6E1_9CHLR|nr:HAMP domain-containing histidine kinase [Chloroflexota bacterium]WJW69453.1 HAMP domain-containing histidine kinase [Chloroflexota bacterium L227-S17]
MSYFEQEKNTNYTAKAISENLDETRLLLQEALREKERLEEALKLQAYQNKTLIQNMPFELVALLDNNLIYTMVEGRFVTQNEPLAELHVVGKHIRETLPSEIYSKIETYLSDIFIRIESIIEFHYENKSYIMKLIPLLDQSGYQLGTIEFIFKGTDHKIFEVSNSLQETEKELTELRNRFISLVSHEFRTPLTTILSSAELMEFYGEKWAWEKVLKHIGFIKSSVTSMTTLLNDILIIGKAESDKLSFDPYEFDIAAFGLKLVEEVQFADETSHKINFSQEGSDFNVFADWKLIRNILWNLLTNATKYSAQDTIVEFELKREPDKIVFTIKDQGIGIPQNDRSRLFEPFHRGNNVGNIPGTGLGLAIVKRCIDRHLGEINISSIEGVGTTIQVVIPLT